MIIKVFNQGSCDGSRHISYLLSEESHEGYRPEVIFGDAAITKAAVKATRTKHRYTAGVISFKQGEDLTELQQQQLIADFKTAFAPFDDPARTNFLFVRHRDKDRLELHWVVAKKDMKTGKSWSIFVPGKANLLLYESFTRLQNYKFGFSQVDGKQMTVQDLSFYTKLFSDLHQKRKDYFISRYDPTPRQNNKKRRHGNELNLRPKHHSHRGTHQEDVGIRKFPQWHGPTTVNNGKVLSGHPSGTKHPCSSAEQAASRSGPTQNQHEQTQYQEQVGIGKPGRGRLISTTNGTSSSLTIEDQLYKLGLALNECERHEAPAIIERINQLRGMREQEQHRKLPKPK